MRRPVHYRHQQRAAVFVALQLFSLVLLVIQLWLFMSALEGILAGSTAMVVPGAIVSALILGANIWMLVGLRRMESED